MKRQKTLHFTQLTVFHCAKKKLLSSASVFFNEGTTVHRIVLSFLPRVLHSFFLLSRFFLANHQLTDKSAQPIRKVYSVQKPNLTATCGVIHWIARNSNIPRLPPPASRSDDEGINICPSAARTIIGPPPLRIVQAVECRNVFLPLVSLL